MTQKPVVQISPAVSLTFLGVDLAEKVMYKEDELIDLLILRYELSKDEAQEAYMRAAQIGPDRMSPLLDYSVMGLSSVQVAQRIWLMWMTEVFPSFRVI